MKPNQYKKNIHKALGIACLAAFSAASSHAVDTSWTAGIASYNNTANWNTGFIPTAGDNAICNNGGTVLIGAGDPDWASFDIIAGGGGGTTGYWEQDGPTVVANSWFRIGFGGGDGSYLKKAGNLSTKRFIIADGAGSIASFFATNTAANNNIAVDGELWCGQGGGADGTITLGGTAAMTVNNWVAIGRDNSTGVFNIGDSASITKSGGGAITFAGIGAGSGTMNQTGGGVTNASSDTLLAENGTGVWNMSGGVAYLATLRFGGAAGTFNLNGGTLIANQIEQSGGTAAINFNGGTLTPRGANATFMTGVPGVLQAGGAVVNSAGFNIGISSVLSDGAGGTLTKQGAGTLTLSAANTYLGATIVQAGKLVATTASLVTSSVVVSNGAGFGVNVVGAIDTQHSPASVNLSGATASLDFDLAAFGNPTLAPLNVTGTLNVAGTVTVNVADANPSVGQFPLVKYGTKTGSGSFVLGTLPAGVSATVVNNTANSSIDLNITSTALIRWGGEVSAAWDIATTANWTNVGSGTSALYSEGAAVILNDTAAGTTAITLAGTVNPGGVVATNDTLAYSVSGAGSISGATGLTKQGANSLSIATVNNYTGATVASGGTLSVNSLANGGSPSAIGASSANAANLVFGGGTLSYTGPTVVTDRGYTVAAGNSTLNIANDVTFNGDVTSAFNGDFAKTGAGTLHHKRLGNTTLSTSGGLGAYDIVNGTVIMDGSAGAQVNTVIGEFAVGTTPNSVTGGNLILTNTTLNVSSWFSIARGTGLGGLTSSVALYNSKLQSHNSSMGYDNNIAGTLQTASLTFNGTSTWTNTGDSNLGESTGGQTFITLNDSSVFVSNQRMQLGWHNAATGHMVIANSAKVVVNAWMSIGNEGGVGSVLVKDSGTLSLPVGASDLNVCDVGTGTGTLTVQDSGNVVANNLFVGKGDGSVGTYNQNGGTSQGRNGGGMYVEVSSQPFSIGTLNLNGGTFKARWIRHVNAGGSYVNFNGAQLIVDRDGGDGVNGNFLEGVTTATVNAGANVDTGTNNISFVVPLVAGGAGGLNKTGTGRLLLTGANTYSGTTVATGTLGGNASVVGNVTAQHLSAGDATGVGQFTVGGNLSFSGDLIVDVATSVSPSNDVIAVTGTITRSGSGSVKVSNLGPVLVVGQKFYLFNGAIVASAGTMAVTGGGATWTNKLALDGSIEVLTVIPAPVFNPGSVATLPDGNKSVTGTGLIGQAYRLWASTDVSAPLNTWTLLNTGTITVSPFTINDLNATNFPTRFYIFSTP